MAKQGTPPDFQPILNASNYQADAGAMINRLKGSSSSLGAAAGLGKAALTGAMAYGQIKEEENIDHLRTGVQEALKPIIKDAQEQSRSLQEENAIKLEGLKQSALAMGTPDSPQDPLTMDPVRLGILQSMNEKIDYFNRAKVQGRISLFDFENRVYSIAKKFTSDNPGYRAEILGSVKELLQDERIMERLSFDESLQDQVSKANENEEKELRGWMQQRNIAFDIAEVDGVFSKERAKLALNADMRNKKDKEALENLASNNKVLNEIQIQDAVDKGEHWSAVAGTYTDVALQAKEIQLAYPDPRDFPKVKEAIVELVNQAKIKARNLPGLGKYLANPEFKAAFEMLDKSFDATKEQILSSASGDDIAKATSNISGVLRDDQQARLYAKFPVAAIDFLTKVGAVPGLVGSTQGVQLRTQLASIFQEVYKGTSFSDPNALTKDPKLGASPVGAIIKSMGLQSISGVSGASDTLDKTIIATGETIKDKSLTPTKSDEIKKLDEFVGVVGGSDMLGAFVDLSPQAMTNYKGSLDVYADTINEDLSRYLSRNNDKNIKLDINKKTGKLIVTGDIDKAFNQTYTARIDKALQAYANLRLETPAEAAKDFYQEYFAGVVTGDTQRKISGRNNPGGLVDLNTGTPLSYSSPEQGVQALEERILQAAKGAVPASEDRKLEESKKAANEHMKNKKLLELGKISQQEYRDRSSSLNNALKASIQELDNRFVAPKKVTITTIADAVRPTKHTTATDISQAELIQRLSNALGVSPREEIDLKNKETLAKLVSEFAAVNGQDITPMRASSNLKTSSDPMDALEFLMPEGVKQARLKKIKDIEAQLATAKGDFKLKLEAELKKQKARLED